LLYNKAADSKLELLKSRKYFQIATCIVLLSFFLLLPGCFTRSRFNNFNWQLDSLRYYTAKFDSVLENQSKELAHLRIDFYTKSNELSDKIEMLNSRLGETESQLMRLSERFGSQKKVPADSEDISKISPEARLIYESAYLNYVKGNYREAISGFESYLKIMPDSPLSDNALYWIGESYTAMGKSQNAVNTFQELMNKYPESNKKPTVLYKMAIIYEEAGDKNTAKLYYNKLIKDFPNSAEATLAKDKLNKEGR
jgi:tol-pal system protein YbgF